VAGPSDVTIKRLFAASSNNCAFPDCASPLVEGETVVGEICHIRSANKGHRRYDRKQTDEKRHGYDNLLLLCRKHHKIVDTEVERYPPALLTEMKKAHEAHETLRFTIDDALVQRLGEMLTAVPQPEPSAPISSPSHPTWTIRELFFHIRPDLIDDHEAKAWERVGRDVMDHFSTGALRVWGRPKFQGKPEGPLKKVNEAGYWNKAKFTYWFIAEDGADNAHTDVGGDPSLPEYSDLRVNRMEALSIWPQSLTAADDRTEIMLVDAARRTYSATRNDPVALHAEAFGNTPEKIIIWYCIWLAQHMQIYGARRPSTKIEPLSLDNPPKDFELTSGNALIMRERNGGAIFENLRVKFDELPEKIKELKNYGKQM
jgi:hypothetical protein